MTHAESFVDRILGSLVGRPTPASTAARPQTEAARARSAKRVQWLAKVLDDQFELPLLGRRFGLDALIGLVPVVGDAVSLALSGLLILEAKRAGVPKRAVLKMVGRAMLDAAIGSVPVVGDAFDFFFKANRANARTALKYLPGSNNNNVA